MTEKELINYCITRKFEWNDRVRICSCINNKDIPLEEKVKFVKSFHWVEEDLTRAKI